MNLLVLGGMSPRNKTYVHQVAEALGPMFGTTVAHEYTHWAKNGAQMDLDDEMQTLHDKARQLDGDYLIFAKSAGAVLAAKGIAAGKLQPRACLFAGTPLNFARQFGSQLDEWIESLDMPIVFVQNTQDPTASSDELQQYLRAHANTEKLQIIEWPGNTHDYTGMAKLKQLVSQFITP